MTLDRLYSVFNSNHSVEIGITPENVKEKIKKEFSLKPDSTQLFVFISGWGENLAHTRRIKKLLLTQGYSFIGYQLPKEMLSADYQRTIIFFEAVKRLITQDIDELLSQYKFSRIELIGVSLGGLVGCLIASGNNLIKKLYLFVPGSSLAESLWLGLRTQHLRKEFETQGVTLDKLEQYWCQIAPENNIDLATTDVFIALSKADKIIPFSCGWKLVEAMRKARLKPEVWVNRFLGHYGTPAAIYLFPGKFLK